MALTDEAEYFDTREEKLAHKLHRSTVDKLMWGRRWLNLEFYERAFADMPEHMELVIAEKDPFERKKREREIVEAQNLHRQRPQAEGRGHVNDQDESHAVACLVSVAASIGYGRRRTLGGPSLRLSRSGDIPPQSWYFDYLFRLHLQKSEFCW